MRQDILQKCCSLAERESFDALVFGITVLQYQDGVIHSSFDSVPELNRYRCCTAAEIVNGPLKYMFGTPADAANHVLFYERFQYNRFPWNWCWLYKAEIIDKYKLRFKEDLTVHEDGIFTCEFLMHADCTICLQDIGYEYHKRADGAGSTYHRNVRFENKMLMVKYRSEISAFVLERTGIDTSTWAYGSYALSTLQLCVALSGQKHGYRQLKRYVSLDEVKRAVKAVPLKGKPKLVLPLFLCKCGCYRLVYIMISLLKKMGISIGL